MIIHFSWPSTARFGGGVVAMYEYANAMARRGHEVHLIHGPKTPDRIERLDQLDWFDFEPDLEHHIVDSLDDPSLPPGDVCFQHGAPARLGQPAVLIQGYKMIDTKLERPAFRAPCPKICVASWLVDIGLAWGSPREQMMHVPIGIDHQVFRLETPLEHRPIDVAMLYTAHPVKGGDDGLAAIEAIREARPDVRVELFGLAPPDRTLPSWITLHTDLERRALATRIYNRSKIFLQPSRREGFGLTSVEAMACGAALVSTDNGGSRDYAWHDQTALVTPTRDPGSLAGAALDLLDDDDRRLRIAANGQRHVRRFDWGLAAQVLEERLTDYLADPARFQGPPGDAPLFLDDTW